MKHCSVGSKKSVLTQVVIGTIATFLFLFTGCGKEAFLVSSVSSTVKAGGNFIVPPKVDILLAEDNSGSMYEVYATVAQQMPGFLLSLEQKGWDYHFVTTPLASNRPIAQVTASKYDSNWGSQWLQPFPGALPSAPGMINPSFFRTLYGYTDFIGVSDIISGVNGNEPGLEVIRSTLYSAKATTSGFLRPDAMLVVIAVGNGDDTSGITYCTRVDGVTVPCEQVGQPGTTQSSFDYYKGQFIALKSNPTQLRFYSAVASSRHQANDCNGASAYAGTRYWNMAVSLGGSGYDVCFQPVASILSQLGNELQATKLALRTRYLMIGTQPDVATIQVTKYMGGNGSQAVTIPQDATNGWTYAGNVTNVYTVDAPVLMNLASGYALELHGAAKLLGDDTANVTFMPFGTHPNSQ